MQITDLLTPGRIALGVSVGDKRTAIHALVGMMQRTGCLNDPQQYEQAVLDREAQGTTGVGGGIAIPHGKSGAVRQPALAALTLRDPIDYDALDGQPVRLIFLIAAPAGQDNLHVQVLARLAQLLMEPDFCGELLAADTPAVFLEVVARREQGATPHEARAGEAASLPPPPPRPRILAVTGCPTGIAHTYMAAEALESAAQRMNVAIKVETNGADGVRDALTAEEIAGAECILIASDKAVETARFAGRPVIRVPVAQALKSPEQLLHRALSGTTPVFRPETAEETLARNRVDFSDRTSRRAALEAFGHKVYSDLMNGISHMIPFVTGGGILLALSYFLDRSNAGAAAFGTGNSLAWLLRSLGNTAFQMMYSILAGFIAVAVGDLPALAPGLLGGLMAQSGMAYADQSTWVSSGFWGALVAGFAAGLLIRLLRRLCSRLPAAVEQVKVTLIYPVTGMALVGLMMAFLINPPLGRFNDWLYHCLGTMRNGSRIVLGAVLGSLMAVDFGGPINKAAYLFGTVTLVNGQQTFMAAVMLGGMVPPIGVALACTLFPKKFTRKERHTALTNYFMGACFITEGALPFALRDPLRVIPSCMVGSAVAAAMSIYFGCTVPAPHGGLFLLPLASHPLLFLLSLAAGSLITALMLAALKAPAVEEN